MISIVVYITAENRYSPFEKHIQTTIGLPFEIIRSVDVTGETVAQFYNRAMKICRYKIVCFLQEEVYFYTPQWGKYILDIFKDPGTGLAGVYGACYLGLYPGGWIDPEECQGQYADGTQFNKPVKRSVRFDEHPITEVAAVEGVLMATRKKLLSSYSFPEISRAGFQGLDLDLSLFLGQQYKLVVTCDILLCRFSKNTLLFPVPEINQILFQKWRHLLPAYSRTYTDDEISRLKLKTLNRFQQRGAGPVIRITNLFSRIRFAMDQCVFKAWMLEKFKLKNRSLPEEIIFSADEELPDRGYGAARTRINNYFNNHPQKKETYKNELAFINHLPADIPEENRLLHIVLPYPFILNKDFHQAPVFTDPDNGMFYVYQGNHRLYYHPGYQTEEAVRKSFAYISIEQHPESPHRYLDNIFRLNRQDVVADIGAAEGNFSLMIVDIVRELIIVESDPVWMEALHKTFEPWKNKVTIVNKLIGGENDDQTITIDRLPTLNPITAVKMDVEGSELKVLHEARDYIRDRHIKLAITLYHRHTDEADIEYLIKTNHYQTHFSKGYMLFIYDKLKPPFFRKGMIKAFHPSSVSL